MNGGIFLVLGSNVGERHLMLSRAAQEIALFATIVQRSSVYATDAWGKTDQPEFLNQALEIATELEPEPLLKQLLEVEARLGRKRMEKWGPRPIDIDIILYGDRIVNSPTLTIPHPEMQYRNFVLSPLRQIAPLAIHPTLRLTISELERRSPDPLKVRIIDESR